MRSAALAALLAAAVAGTASPARHRLVHCSESIDGTKFPYPHFWRLRPELRYRLVLGAVSVPPAYHEQIVRNGKPTWPYFFKAGLVVRSSGDSVFISVPHAWRTRLGIAWGYGGHGVFSSLRIAGCRAKPTIGFAYSGGFYLRSAPACVPLIFRVGRRSATVRFGLGRRCGVSRRFLGRSSPARPASLG
jgi:hypothetical protein